MLRPLVATPYRIGALVLAITTMGWRAWTVSRWSWQDDDWLYMDGTHDLDLFAYLFQDYNGHLMPGGFLVSWIVTKVAPLEFWVPVVLVSVASGVLVLVWARTLAHLVGEHVVVLAPLALLSLTPLLIRPTVWWASALQALPLQFALALLVGLAARAAREPRRGDAWRLALLFLAALLFWQKSLLVLVPVTAVLVHLAHGPLHARMRGAIALMWPSILLAVAYVPVFLAVTAGRSSSNSLEIDTSRVSIDEGSEFFARGFSEVLVPALLGGPWGTLPTDADPWIHQEVRVSVVFGFIALTGALYLVTRVREGWLLLTAWLTYLLAAWGLILFSSRFELSGQATSTTERFHVDGFAVSVVLVTLALSGARASGSAPRMPSAPASIALVGAVVASLAIGNVWQAGRIGTSPAKPWVSEVNDSFAGSGPVSLLDTAAPGTVLPGFWLEYARLSNMVAVLPGVTFGEPAPRLRTVLESGELAPVEVNPDSKAEPGPVQDCGYSLEPGRSVDVPMTQKLFDWTWVVQLDTLAADGGELTLTTEGRSLVVEIAPGLQTLQAPFAGAVDERVTLEMSDDAGTVCLAGLTIGNAVAGAPEPGL